MTKKTNEQNNIETAKKTKIFSGKVVSDKMKDTVVVSVDSYKKHSMYGKYIRRQKGLRRMIRAINVKLATPSGFRKQGRFQRIRILLLFKRCFFTDITEKI